VKLCCGKSPARQDELPQGLELRLESVNRRFEWFDMPERDRMVKWPLRRRVCQCRAHDEQLVLEPRQKSLGLFVDSVCPRHADRGVQLVDTRRLPRSPVIPSSPVLV
jgi:hypothetical protein